MAQGERIDRRHLMFGLALPWLGPGVRQAGPRAPRILLRGSWQSVNIGDIGHTPGALQLIERYFPEAEVTLWPGRLEHGSRELLTKAFPRLRILDIGTPADRRDAIGPDGRPQSAELAAAWDSADFMLHGSGSGFSARAQLAAWHRTTGKAYGVFGTSADPISGFGTGRDPEGGTLKNLRARMAALPPNHLDRETRSVVDGAAFIFTRETLTRDYFRSQGVRCPIVEFGPDSQLGMRLRDDQRAAEYLKAHALAHRQYLCVIPRLRYTPYYRINNVPRTKDDDVRDAINERTTASDHARLRDMIAMYVRRTGHRVLACPEMIHEIPLAKEVLVDPLPDDVRSHVVWRDSFWLPDEAASVYASAQAVVSMECHSPLIALTNGTPAFYVRQPTDTCKGQMYRDLWLGDWCFEIEETTGAALWEQLARIHARPADAAGSVRAFTQRVERLQRRMVDVLKTAVNKASSSARAPAR